MTDKPELIQPSAFEPPGAKVNNAPKPRSVWPRYVLMALVGVFLLVFFSAKSLTLGGIPAAASSSLSNGFSVAMGKRYLVWNGDYQLHVEAPGFYPLEQPVTIAGDDVALTLELQRLPDTLNISGEPVAEVSVDGETRGLTPLSIELAPGEHTLNFVAENYRPLTQVVSIKGGGNEVALQPVLQPAWADVTLQSNPAGATVMLGDKPLGQTPGTVAVPEGEQQLLLVLDGYKRESVTLTAQAGVAQTLAPITLSEADASLVLKTTPQGVAVMLDGQYQGQTPLTLALPANAKKQLSLLKSGYQTLKKSVQLNSGESRSWNLTLAAKLGQVEIRHQAAAATLLIDGVRQSRNSGVFNLPATAQRIELRQAGFASYKKRITPKPGFPQRLDITLAAVQAAGKTRAVAKTRLQSSNGSWLRLLKPYNFTMGASRREAGRRANERLRAVTMDRAFYLAETEVSNAQFRKFSAQHSSGRVENNSLNGENRPVVNITWLQAVQYCNWLSKREGLTPVYKMAGSTVQSVDLNANGYRLPTEAEWAWAARAGKSASDNLRKFSWGQELRPPAKAENIADSSAAQIVARIVDNYNDSQPVSAPLASFSANQHGLYDMGGNVAEWVHDFYGQSQLSAAASAANPAGPDSGSYHVVRGASWRHGSIVELRLSYRDYEQKSRDDLGFRVARTME